MPVKKLLKHHPNVHCLIQTLAHKCQLQKQFSEMELCESCTKLNDNTEKLSNEVLLLKLSYEAQSMQITDLSKSNKETVMTLMDIQDKVDLLQHGIKILKTQNTTLYEILLKLEFHQCRNNLVFSGIKEAFNETSYDYYNKIIELLSKVMDVSNINIVRWHRLGRFSKHQPRPIIVIFLWYGDVTSRLKVKSKLPSGMYINEDLPSEWVECKKRLRPVMKEALKLEHYKGKVKLQQDKLIIYNVLYSVDTLHELPKNVVAKSSCQKVSDQTIAFFGPKSIESNMYQSPFLADNVYYQSSEHYIQAKKAELFDDVQVVKILNTSSPFEAKRLGGRMHNLNIDKWSKNAKDIATQGVIEKFRSNENIHIVLISFADDVKIVEASHDHMWEIGVSLSNEHILFEQNWHSDGLMAEVYKVVRVILK